MSRAEGAGQAERVRRFYDRNAARFERLGQGGASMHRAVWGPGVTSRQGAFHHVEDLVLQALPEPVGGTAPGRTAVGGTAAGRPRVVDLGCGVGASLLYLAGRADLAGEGVTISPAQAERAAALVAAAGLGDRVRCRVGDFLAPPDDLAGADLAFSIEAFVHGPDPAGYFRSAARLLRPGGRLVLCDDFLTGLRTEPGIGPGGAGPASRAAGPAARRAGAADRRVETFRRGWRVGSLVTVQQARELAAEAGLRPVDDRDLTPFLELRRPRDRWITLMLALGRPLRLRGDYWLSLQGGDALQHALIGGQLGYHLLTFEKGTASEGPDPAEA